MSAINVEESPPEGLPAAPGLARSAGLLSIGNFASRILGLVREIIIASYFGASGEVSAFRIASQVPTMLYDFLIGGMLSAALVPVLSEYAQLRRRTDFIQLAGVLISLFTVVLGLLVLLLEVAAPGLTWLLAAGFRETNPELLALTTTMLRLMAPAVWLFSMAGLLTAMLYAWQRFTLPALAAIVYNLGIVIAAPLLAARFGIASLSAGILLGSLAQLLLMVWDLQRAGLRLHFTFNWRHPALRKILVLYAPIAAGLVVALFQVGLDRRLATGTHPQSVAWMSAATTLQQLPLGLISVAISVAALPRLSQYFAAGQEAEYRQTLGRGLRIVLLLIAPAAVGLWLLGEPVTRLLFERRAFTALDTAQVVQALNIYVVGMLFAAIDFPLNYAFYARNNTLLPALVGVVSVLVYVIVAFALLERLSFLGLVWADSAKQASHALIMIALLGWRVKLVSVSALRSLVRIGCGTLVMTGSISLIRQLLMPWLSGGQFADLLLLLFAGGTGVLAYGALLYWAGEGEVQRLGQWLHRRIGARQP